MTASVVIQNVIYLAGAVALALIGGLVVTIRHHKPKSVESNMASFNKGLRALAPETVPHRRHQTAAIEPRASRVRTVQPDVAGVRSGPRHGSRAVGRHAAGRRAGTGGDAGATEADTG